MSTIEWFINGVIRFRMNEQKHIRDIIHEHVAMSKEYFLTNLIDVKVYFLKKGIFFHVIKNAMWHGHVVFHDSNVSNLMFNTLGTTKILEIKNFLKSYEVCQMY